MFNQHSYHRTLRKLIVGFGTLFNDIEMIRYATDQTTEDKRIKVPVEWAPKDKYLQRLRKDPEISRPVEFVLPLMSYDFGAISYDAVRKENTLNKRGTANANTSIMTYQFGGVPYNIDMNLYIYARYQEDAFQIIEQILPYFTPDLMITLKEVPENQRINNVQLVLNGITYEDNYEGTLDSEDDRILVWTLNFNAKMKFYGPVKTGSIIRDVDIYFHDETVTANNPVILDFVGVDPNPSNAAPNGTYTYTTTITAFPDAVRE